jgi:hypothetical protein
MIHVVVPISGEPIHSRKGRIAFSGVLLFMSVLFLIYTLVFTHYTNNIESADPYNTAYEVHCPHCNHTSEEKIYTFWYNDGMLCNGSYEYNMQNADYTLFKCDYCGSSWKHYLKTNPLKISSVAKSAKENSSKIITLACFIFIPLDFIFIGVIIYNYKMLKKYGDIC